jgi:uroporphyrinogen-III synthase
VKVVITRVEVGELGRRLETLGHEVVHCPLIRTEPLGDEPLDLSEWDWVVVTSPNGARELGRRLVRPPRHLAAIGPGTAEALSSEGLHADLVPRVHTQEGLRDELPPGRTLLAAAEGARRGVLDADFLPLYRTYELMAELPPGDVALLASPSAARALAATGAHIPVVAIGPQTEAEARTLGLDVAAVADTSDLDGLVAAVESLRE